MRAPEAPRSRRAARRRPGAPASPGRRPRPQRRLHPWSSKPARATVARRRTVGLSPSAASTAGSPAGSPMAPSAATAASRQRGSACRSRSHQGRHGRAVSTLAQEPGGTDDDERIGIVQRRDDGGGERRAGTPAAHRGRGLHGASTHRRRPGGQRGGHLGGRQLRPGGPAAPRAATCTAGSGSSRARRAVAASPRWPAMTSRRRKSARRSGTHPWQHRRSPFEYVRP